ncbi:MAG: response regulator transcription factor [Anaerolineales bacterium]|nr:response regulator transcription factor [Anaerolineales bacterium]
MTANTRILVVDDEPPIVDLLSYNLEQAHYDVVVARDGEEAIQKARQENPDLIILDLMLPVIDGLEVCRTLRKERDVPIIMLTARGDEIDRVVGLELGADDYVVKPFSVRELLARVRNVLRRTTSPVEHESDGVIRIGTLQIDESRRSVLFDEQIIGLTTLEFDVLYYLALHPGRVLTRERLLEEVWGYNYHGDARVVDALIKRVRKKLNQSDPAEGIIATVRGVGYKLDDMPG